MFGNRSFRWVFFALVVTGCTLLGYVSGNNSRVYKSHLEGCAMGVALYHYTFENPEADPEVLVHQCMANMNRLHDVVQEN